MYMPPLPLEMDLMPPPSPSVNLDYAYDSLGNDILGLLSLGIKKA